MALGREALAKCHLVAFTICFDVRKSTSKTPAVETLLAAWLKSFTRYPPVVPAKDIVELFHDESRNFLARFADSSIYKISKALYNSNLR